MSAEEYVLAGHTDERLICAAEYDLAGHQVGRLICAAKHVIAGMMKLSSESRSLEMAQHGHTLNGAIVNECGTYSENGPKVI